MHPGPLHECDALWLLDFSEHMLGVSRDRLKRFPMARFVQGNFKAPDWAQVLHPPYTAVVAMQAVHEIRHKRYIPPLYHQLREVISPGGMLAVCDGIPGDSPPLWRQSLFLTGPEQIAAFVAAGFRDAVIDTAVGNMVLVMGRPPT
jgi:hypothetical protein